MIKVLSQKYIDAGRTDDDLRYTMAKTNKVKISTIDRWFRENDVMLTTATNLQIMASHFQIKNIDSLLSESEVFHKTEEGNQKNTILRNAKVAQP